MDRVRVFRLRNRQFAIARTRAQLLSDTAPQPAAYAVPVSSPAEIDAKAYEFARVRDLYHSGQAAVAVMRPRVLRSWERCRELGVDPNIKSAPIRADSDVLRTANERLLRAAEPILGRLVDAFSGTGYAVIMSDAHGNVLVLASDPDVRRRLFRHGIVPGADWSEAAIGTNAVGTAILDRRPLQLLGAEHFCDAPVSFTCTAAPIYAPGTAEVVGVLDITGSYTLVRPHLVGLVMGAALEIEESLAFL